MSDRRSAQIQQVSGGHAARDMNILRGCAGGTSGQALVLQQRSLPSAVNARGADTNLVCDDIPGAGW